jgi:hypothetical protein
MLFYNEFRILQDLVLTLFFNLDIIRPCVVAQVRYSKNQYNYNYILKAKRLHQ